MKVSAMFKPMQAGRRATACFANALVVAALIGMPYQASAAPEDITLGELALTPPFCMDVQAIPVTGWSKDHRSPRASHWEALMGNAFWAAHHYCWALINLNRAKIAGTPANTRRFLTGVAIDDFEYVLRHAPADFVLAPEIHYRIGMARVVLGEYGTAIDEFSLSRKLKPDYWPAYVGEADLLLKAGRRDEARQLVESGLKLLPDEPNLLAALSRANSVKPGAR